MLPKPIHLNGLTIEVPVALGPMAGVTDLPFRTLCREQGCGMFYTEMVSAQALHYRNRNAQDLLRTEAEEHPLGVQLFGSDPNVIAEQAKALEERFDFIDFNMGCHVPKVVKNHEGSWLLQEKELVREIFTELCRAVSVPVTCKIRKGFNEGEEQAVEIAKILEDCGVALIAVHARTRSQFYSGKADWGTIRRVKEAVSVPVIGNGDVVDGESAKRMFDETGCDGVMVARAAQGNPFLFREIKSYFETGTACERPTAKEIYDTVIRHADMQLQYKGEHIGIREMRKHVSWYTTGMPGSAKFRNEINQMTDMDSLKEACRKVMLNNTFIDMENK